MQVSTPESASPVLAMHKVFGGISRGILDASTKESGRGTLDLGCIGPSVLSRGHAALVHSFTLEPSNRHCCFPVSPMLNTRL